MSANCTMFCAIDIGTSYSGYAFAPRETLANNSCEIYASQWESDLLSHKTPTVILLDPAMNFHAFGHTANKKFSELAETGKEHTDWFYFKDFKMELYDKNLTREAMITDIHGKYASAQRIFQESIKFLRGHFVDMLKSKNTGVLEDKIYYVVTVPAIWSDAAKQFTTEAAVMAGICPGRLKLAYEPEAAALYYKNVTCAPYQTVGHEPLTFVIERPYVVVDLGGGTSDITVQKISSAGKIQNLHKASGGPWGGNKINRYIVELLVKLFGDSLFQEFCVENMDDFFDLLQKIEIKKRNVTEYENDSFILEVPSTLVGLYGKKFKLHESILQHAIEKADLEEIVTAKKGNKISVKYSYFQTHFKEICTKTIDLVKDILQKETQCHNLRSLIMVGGFSESKLVQSIFKESFPEYDIKIPLDAGLAVLKGAVIYGFDSSIIQTRVCPYTYGIAVLKKFDHSVHELSKSFVEDGQRRADDCFEKFFEVDEPLAIGVKRSIGVNISHVEESRQKDRTEPKEIEVFSSALKSPLYTTDPTCRSHGMISVYPPNGIWPVYVKGRVEIEVTGTDKFSITYIDNTTGHTTSGTIDFLRALFDHQL